MRRLVRSEVEGSNELGRVASMREKGEAKASSGSGDGGVCGRRAAQHYGRLKFILETGLGLRIMLTNSTSTLDITLPATLNTAPFPELNRGQSIRIRSRHHQWGEGGLAWRRRSPSIEVTAATAASIASPPCLRTW